MKPKVSVLIPSYNQAGYIKDTVKSVLNQTFSDLELIILDDCSTDGSLEIINGIADSRIRVIALDTNKGVVNSINTMTEYAAGEYIAVLGADDLWLPEKLQKQVAYLDEHPDIAACFSETYIINGDTEIIKGGGNFPRGIFNFGDSDRYGKIKEFFVGGNHLCHSSVLIRAGVQKELGDYDPAYRQLHDFDMWVRLLLKYDIYVFPEPLVKYRFVSGAQNISKNSEANTLRLFNEAKVILQYLFDNIEDSDFIKSFSDELICKAKTDPVHIVCEKFFILKKYGVWGNNCNSLAFDFLMKNKSPEVITCLENDYNFSVKDLYNYTGQFVSNYKSDIYPKMRTLEKNIIYRVYNKAKRMLKKR